eukprot:tig00001623_g9421.t1
MDHTHVSKRNQSFSLQCSDKVQPDAKRLRSNLHGSISIKPVLKRVAHISDYKKEIGHYPNPSKQLTSSVVPACEDDVFDVDRQFVGTNQFVLTDIVLRGGIESYLESESPKVVGPFYLRAGPRKEIIFHPKDVRAAIVTCGGLCPGLNTVVRELVMCLSHSYGVQEIHGMNFGYRGFYDPAAPPRKLEPRSVSRAHQEGGTLLGSSRGGMDREKIIAAVIERGYNHIYVIGGDGTHRGAQLIADDARARNLKIAVVGIPKTIDNDIPIIDKSFGFDTAVEEASRAIASAHVEAHCAPNGVAIVKLMGRDAGFIAMHASLASRDVNVCLIPEIKFRMGPLLAYVEERLRAKGHAVIVVAEGAGQDILAAAAPQEKDASGNRRYADIGLFLKDEIARHFKAKGEEANVKYIDPTYMIRSGPANAADSVLCTNLAHSAVHGAMAGYTAFTTGLVNQRVVMIPFGDICGRPQRVDPRGRMWGRLLTSTGQPDLY